MAVQFAGKPQEPAQVLNPATVHARVSIPLTQHNSEGPALLQ